MDKRNTTPHFLPSGGQCNPNEASKRIRPKYAAQNSVKALSTLEEYFEGVSMLSS